MGFLAINVNTYVDIATTIASQGRPYGELRWKCKDPTTKSDFVEPRNGRSEWEERIEYWKNKFPDNGTPIEQCADLKDIEIGTIILQQPIPGMAVWNVLQACYELDRIIFASPKDRKIVAGWEKLPVFEYLDDIQVTEYWKNSLAEFTKEWKRLAEESNEGDFKKPGRKVGSKRRNKKLSSLDDRISDIRRSVDRLEDLWSKLHRTFSQNMKGSMVARNMLDAIGKSIESKFSMIGSALTGEENKEVPNDPLKKGTSNQQLQCF